MEQTQLVSPCEGVPAFAAGALIGPESFRDLDEDTCDDESAFVDAAFDDVADDLKEEQRLLGHLLWRPALHSRMIHLDPDDFADPLHARLFAIMRALWRSRRPATAHAVAEMLWHVTPLLKAGDRLTAIEELVFDRLGWSFPRYIHSLIRIW